MNKAAHIYFNPQEVAALTLALGGLIEDLNAAAKNPTIPWTPEARKHQKDIVSAAKSAARKLEKFTGIKCDLPQYLPGDESDFFTKES
jgi:hypothetical protein